jgi:hypothetical protein
LIILHGSNSPMTLHMVGWLLADDDLIRIVTTMHKYIALLRY